MQKGRAMWGRLALAIGLGAAASPAAAHPHMWIDTGVEVIFDAEGRAEAIRLTWVYDEFSSLVYVEERALDADHDGNATPEEAAELSGFDMNWDAGFNGDTHVLSGTEELALSGPEGWTADYKAGRITTTHLRRLEAPAMLDKPLIVQVYDPGYYTSYTMAKRPVFTPGLPTGCEGQVFAPAPGEAEQKLLDILSEYSADTDVEADFPKVGAQFAEEVRVTCRAD